MALGVSGRVYESRITESNKYRFEEVKNLSNLTVVDISGTFDFCFAVLNDGRVFGHGNNIDHRLCLSKTKSFSTFTFIDSLNEYKIVSLYTGSCHSIFKTTESKMIVCGSNESGQLFIPHKDFVYQPEEVPRCQGFTFCVTGSGVSAAFFDIEEPSNFSNKKIKEVNGTKVESKIKTKTGIESKSEITSYIKSELVTSNCATVERTSHVDSNDF